ncbi:MAG: hypothetical protein WED09_00015, partial [Homoserinimonas sp.]
WKITRTGGSYRLHPPTSTDPTSIDPISTGPDRTPRPMPHKSAALRDLEREQQQRKQHRVTG